MRLISLMILAFLAAPAAAQTAFPCDWQARADAIVEPWDDNTATFANGAVRVALFYLLILHPPYDELGSRACTVVGLDENLGYANIDFNGLEAGYDPARGLTFEVPATIYLPEQSFQNPALVSITVNQATGAVTVKQALGNE
jgi:hypothetical protein